MIQKTARNQDTIQRNVPYVAKITPRITRDALFTETWQRRDATQLWSTTFTNSTQPLILTNNTQLPSLQQATNNPFTSTPFYKHSCRYGQHTYAQITKNSPTSVLDQSTLAEQLATFLTDFKAMFSQLISQNSTILNLLTNVISKLNPQHSISYE